MAETPSRKPAKKAGAKKAAKKTAAKKTGAKKAGAKKSTAPRTTAGKRPPTREEIEQRAYYISEHEGGDPTENWLRAERELSS